MKRQHYFYCTLLGVTLYAIGILTCHALKNIHEIQTFRPYTFTDVDGSTYTYSLAYKFPFTKTTSIETRVK